MVIDWFSWQVWFVILLIIVILIWIWRYKTPQKEFVGLNPLYGEIGTEVPENRISIPKSESYDIDQVFFIDPVDTEKIISKPYTKTVDEETISISGNTPVAPIRKITSNTSIKNSETIARKSRSLIDKNKQLSLLVSEENVSEIDVLSVKDENLYSTNNSNDENTIPFNNINPNDKNNINISPNGENIININPNGENIINPINKNNINKEDDELSETESECSDDSISSEDEMELSSDEENCKYKSIGEELTCRAFKKILKDSKVKNNIRPNFLINPKTGRKLEIDCWSDKHKMGAEYNGIQHYEFPSIFFSVREKFEEQLYRDQIKRELSDLNGTPIITVPCIVDSYIFDENEVKYKYIKRSKEERYKLIYKYMKKQYKQYK